MRKKIHKNINKRLSLLPLPCLPRPRLGPALTAALPPRAGPAVQWSACPAAGGSLGHRGGRTHLQASGLPRISQGVQGRAKSKLWWLSPEVCSAGGRAGRRPFVSSTFNHRPSDSLGAGESAGRLPGGPEGFPFLLALAENLRDPLNLVSPPHPPPLPMRFRHSPWPGKALLWTSAERWT